MTGVLTPKAVAEAVHPALAAMLNRYANEIDAHAQALVVSGEVGGFTSGRALLNIVEGLRGEAVRSGGLVLAAIASSGGDADV